MFARPLKYLFAVLYSVVAASTGAAQSISNGHRILLERGLQVEAMVFTQLTGNFDLTRWNESNFTTINFAAGYQYPNYAMPPGSTSIPWSRVIRENETGPTYDLDLILPQEAPYVPNLTRLMIGNEQDLTNFSLFPAIEASMSSLQQKYPNVLVHIVQAGGHPIDQTRTFMQQIAPTRPDLLMFDTYPFYGNGNGYTDGGSPTIFYRDLEKYRTLSLEGADGTGQEPIPFGAFLQTFTYAGLYNHVVSESENRLNNFASWAFGAKLVDSYVYEQHPYSTTEFPVLFSGSGTVNPTPLFYQVAETNRQSRNLGPALVRLISTDARMVMGLHKGGFMNLFNVTNSQPEGVALWSPATSAVPYLTGVAAANLGILNNGLRGDVVIAGFEPLAADFTNAGHENDAYFMIVNGLTDGNGTAAETRQWIRLNFDFGASGIDGLLRLSRLTGQVEEVPLVHISGSQYYLDLYLDGGTGDLFKFDNGGTFVPEPASVSAILIGIVFAMNRRPKTGVER